MKCAISARNVITLQSAVWVNLWNLIKRMLCELTDTNGNIRQASQQTVLIQNKMIAKVPVNSEKLQRNLKFQLDTAETCNMLTRLDCARMGKRRLTSTRTEITLCDESTLKPDGWWTLTIIDNSKEQHQLIVLVTDTKQHNLFSPNTCMDRNRMQTKELVHIVSESLEDILLQYEDVFHVVCFPGE